VALTQAHNKGVRDINFTHNGNFVLAADDTGAVKISTIALKPLQDIRAHSLVRGRLWLGKACNCFRCLMFSNHLHSVPCWPLAV